MSRNRGEHKKRAAKKKTGAKVSSRKPRNDRLNKALSHHQSGRIDQAREIYREILQKEPENIEAMHLGGVAALQDGDFLEAIYLIQKAIECHSNPPYHYYDNLGLAYQRTNNSAAAIACFQKAIQLHPKEAQIYLNLGNSYFDQLQFAEAADAYKKVLSFKPNFGEVYDSLGQALEKQGEIDGAVSCYKKSMTLSPNYPLPYLHMGIYCQTQGKVTESIGYFKKALSKNPEDPDICNSLGTLFQDQGKIETAVGWYERALALKPEFTVAHSNLLLCKNYMADINLADLANEHKRWQTCHAFQNDGNVVHANERSTDRVLRIGYVSPDFSRHSVAFFIESVIAAHDRKSFRVYCYTTGVVSDDVTQRFKSLADEWRNISTLSDERAADLIRRDQIDILVDLAGHTEKNRLPLFSRKPAPVQVTYLGYPNTTGLEAMDYRFTDAMADPPGKMDALYSEQLVHLKNGFLCYNPPAEAPPVEKRIDSEKARVVFGSFNHVAKINPAVVRIWSKILKTVDGARFFLKAKSFTDPGTVERVQALFRENGISDDRVEYCGYVPDMRSYFNLYNRIDIALDTYPYNGTTTTCDALWMGTPVITLSGNSHASRVGRSLLSSLGLIDQITSSWDEYIEKTVALSHDTRKLQKIQTGLRTRMANSPLLDTNGFTHDLEEAYKDMWETWCRAGESDEIKSRDISISSESTLDRTESDVEIEAIRLINQGEAYFEAGDLAGAQEAFLRAIEIAPSLITAYNNLGVLYWHEGNAEKSIEYLTRALAINPADETARYNLNKIQSSSSEFGPIPAADTPETPRPAHTKGASTDKKPAGGNPVKGTDSFDGERELLIRRIESLPYWYHRIELPHGIVTPGWAPIDASAYRIPSDLSGKRVLDIGAWDGFWTFQALHRGAKEVVAIDDFSDYLGTLDNRDRNAWETFDLCRSTLGYTEDKCKRFEMSVYDISESELGRFDIVFFFGTLYHLRYPLMALDKISAVCNEGIYVESAICDDFSPYQGGFGKGYPDQQMVMEFYPGKQYGENETNWWSPSLHCLKHMINAAGFKRVEGWKLVEAPKELPFCRGFVSGQKE